MQKVTDSFELPKDIVLGLPIVTAYGYNAVSYTHLTLPTNRLV